MSFAALDSALTGDLFATPAMRAVFSDEGRLGAMLRVEAALARAQAELGLVPPHLAPAIEAVSPAAFDLATLGPATALAGVPTIPFVKALQALLPPDLESHLHKGATTQDVLDTALVLQAREGLNLLSGDLGPVLDGFAALAEAHRETPCAGRTYGQHAAPISFGYKAAVWLTGVADAAEPLAVLRPRVLAVSLGGPVGTLGVGGPPLLEAFARDLNLSAPPLAWHALRGRMVELGGWLGGLVGALAKIATDVAHLASTEVAEVAEPHLPGRGGSSAMPHKRNPVGATVILAAHAAAKGHLVTLMDGIAAAHERPAGAWHGEWHALPSLFGVASGAMREARTLAEGLVVDPGRMRANLDATHGLLFADVVAARLAPALGRGGGHALVERAADGVRRAGGRAHLRAVLASDPEVRTVLDEAALDALFDLAPALAAAAPWIDRALAHAAAVRAQLPGG